MASLNTNIVGRVKRLPKPKTTREAMQPVFEAISNAIHATEARFENDVTKKGKIFFEAETDRKKENVSIYIEDNGVALNTANYEAFLQTDTENKISFGGKGVGRLLLLSAFSDIVYDSIDKNGNRKHFRFKLSNSDQIIDLPNGKMKTQGTSVKLSGIRKDYESKFPGRGEYIRRHFNSHFLPVLISDKCPQIEVVVGEESYTYPAAIDEIIRRKKRSDLTTVENYDLTHMLMMECDAEASSDLKGTHFIHFIAHGRTVHSEKIDQKLGFKKFGEDEESVFHACVYGDFLDDNVNQQRTSFEFEDQTLRSIINDALMKEIKKFLKAPLKEHKKNQRKKIKKIVKSYPSVGFAGIKKLQKSVPTGELKPDALYGKLSQLRYRKDEKQNAKIKSVFKRIKNENLNENTLRSALSEATKIIESAEQKSLAEYVLRRKVVLDFFEVLLRKVRSEVKDSSYEREDLLHTFLCPMRIKTVGDSESKLKDNASHDLWIVDERLTFAKYLSSDVPFDEIVESYGSKERPDLLVFDYIHGMRISKESNEILLVEFKKPGRKEYSLNENPIQQIERYIKKLQSGKTVDVNGRPVKVDENTVFYCYIIADELGKIIDWTYTWPKTPDGRGKVFQPNAGFKGFIELLPWDNLLRDAKARNSAFFDRTGITADNVFDN